MEKIDKSSEKVREMFSQIAPKYDLLNHVLSLNIDRHWRRETVRALSLDRGIPVLDVCTGTGDLAFAIAKKYRGEVPVIGTDFCEPMLRLANTKRGRNSSDSAVQFLEADTERLPFDDNHFQAVTVAFGIRNVANTIVGIQEMLRVCRLGGQIAILEFSRPTFPILKNVYDFYFRSILPRIGQRLAKNDRSAYNYLPLSVQSFPSGNDMIELMTAAGVRNTKQTPMTLGTVTLYLGIK